MAAEGLAGLALSTCLASGQASGARELLDSLAPSGLRALELEYRISTPIWQRLQPLLRPGGWSVSSLHNYFPLPPDIPPERASGDLFNLASGDPDQIRLARRYTMATLEAAHQVEAPAVVLHLGWVEGLEHDLPLKEAARAGGITPALAELLAVRPAGAAAALDNVSRHLDRLLPRAAELGLRLGLENRFHPHQVPDIEEMALLLRRFAGGPLGLWYDLGHAWVQARAGLAPAEQWLQRFGDGLVGCHLHDSQKELDHLPPGAGDMDWPALAAELASCPLKVLEVHPPASAEEVAESAGMLADLFAQARPE